MTEDPVPVVFIGGSHRTGSTLVERILDQVPGYFSVGELVQLWTTALAGYRPCGCGKSFRECDFWQAVGVVAFGGWDRVNLAEVLQLQRTVDRTRYIPFMMMTRPPGSYGRRLEAYGRYLTPVYRAIREVSGCRAVVDSTKRPSTALVLSHNPTLDLRLIHMVRDSRGVAHSWTQRPSFAATPGDPPLAVLPVWRTAAHWDVDNILIEWVRRRSPPSGFLRYESLVTATREEIARVLGEIDRTPEASDLAFIEAGSVLLAPGHSVAGNPARFRSGRVAVSADYAWRQDMPAPRRALASVLTWPLLARYGYAGRAVEQPPGATAEVYEQSPSVSVVIPTHRRPHLLRGAVQAVLDQSYGGEVHVIVVADGEEPARPAVAVPPRRTLSLIRNERSPGPAGAYNTGILASSGELVALCDDDDEWLPGKLELQVAALREHPEAVAATCGIHLCNGRTTERLPSKELVVFRDLLRSRMREIHTSTLVVRRDRLLGEVGLYDEDVPASYAEDFDWILRASRIAPIVTVRRSMVRVRLEHSHFTGRWADIAAAFEYLVGKYPEFEQEPRGLARVLGQIAFAHASAGHPATAAAWAKRCLRVSPLQVRGYLALAVNAGLLKPGTYLRVARAMGKGI